MNKQIERTTDWFMVSAVLGVCLGLGRVAIHSPVPAWLVVNGILGLMLIASGYAMGCSKQRKSYTWERSE